MQASIRSATHADAPTLSAFMRESFLEANGHCSTRAVVEAFLDTVYQPELQRAEIANPAIVTWLAYSGPTLTGFAQLRLTTPAPEGVVGTHPVELGRIYLAPALKGTGLAAELMQRILDRARAEGADAIWLKVWQQSPRAIAFYRKHGFEIAAPTTFMIGDEPKPNWIMLRSPV